MLGGMKSVAAVVLICVFVTTASEECQSEDFKMELLQKQLTVESTQAKMEAKSMPKLKLLFRSTYSNDPVQSAKWFARYFTGVTVEDTSFASLPEDSVTAAAVRPSASGINSYKVVFARGPEIDEGMGNYAKTVATDWKERVLAHESWSHWADLHDGLLSYPFNLTAARVDGLDFVITETVTRFYIPGTAWTFELRSAEFGDEAKTAEDQKYLDAHAWYIEEECREGESFLDSNERNDISLWWKTTYAVANASKARSFAHEVLGASDVACPFPYPPSETCSGALWVDVSLDSDHGFELHFVELLQQHADVVEFHEYHAQKAVDLSRGCMSAALYDNVAFEVESLDPFVEKLDSMKVPSLVSQIENGLYSLVFAFPGNEAVVIQLRSSVLTVKEPQTPTPSYGCMQL